MQIKHATARGVGYTGSASGLFDAETNLTYAVRYLAGAYRAAGGNRAARSRFTPAAITGAERWRGARRASVVAEASTVGHARRRRLRCATTIVVVREPSAPRAEVSRAPPQGESILAAEPGAMLQFLNHARTKRAISRRPNRNLAKLRRAGLTGWSARGC